jgi:NAD(P)-dependent dehydrogenase (short-subunit alcohol dehydrogenase family)
MTPTFPDTPTGFGPRLAGKVALISGIASGQGRAAALLFARHGAIVVGSDLNLDGARAVESEARELPDVAEHGGALLALRVDVADEDDVAAWVQTAADRFGRIDVLYNNAGFGLMGMVHEMPLDQWRATMRGELDTVFVPCKHAIPHMRRSEQGATSIINTASVSGMISTLLPGMPGGMAHAAGKGGVLAMTRSLAQEYAPDGIRVNAISPGSVDTPSLALAGYDTPEFLADVVANLCIKRRARPEEVALLALYLASDESAYVTGANFVIDGGWSIC